MKTFVFQVLGCRNWATLRCFLLNQKKKLKGKINQTPLVFLGLFLLTPLSPPPPPGRSSSGLPHAELRELLRELRSRWQVFVEDFRDLLTHTNHGGFTVFTRFSPQKTPGFHGVKRLPRRFSSDFFWNNLSFRKRREFLSQRPRQRVSSTKAIPHSDRDPTWQMDSEWALCFGTKAETPK